MKYRCVTDKSEDDTGDMEDFSCIYSPCIVLVTDGTPKPKYCLYDETFQEWEECNGM